MSSTRPSCLATTHRPGLGGVLGRGAGVGVRSPGSLIRLYTLSLPVIVGMEDKEGGEEARQGVTRSSAPIFFVRTTTVHINTFMPM